MHIRLAYILPYASFHEVKTPVLALTLTPAPTTNSNRKHPKTAAKQLASPFLCEIFQLHSRYH